MAKHKIRGRFSATYNKGNIGEAISKGLVRFHLHNDSPKILSIRERVEKEKSDEKKKIKAAKKEGKLVG